MKHTQRIALAFLLTLCLAFAACAQAEEAVTVTEIQKYGNLVLSISGTDFLALGYE